MESLQIILRCVLAAVTYGVLHEQVTARVCVEYFTIGHPPVFATDDPTALAFGWGVIATGWVGLFLGVPLAFAARAAPRPRLTARQLVRPLAALMGCVGFLAFVAGIVGYHREPPDFARLLDIFERVPPEKHAAFLADPWAHSASYLFGLVGAIALWVWAWKKRGKLGPEPQVADSLLQEIVQDVRAALAERVGEHAVGRLLGCSLGATVAPFALMSIYLLVSRGITGFSATGDWCGLGLSLLAGAGSVLGLPIAAWQRVLLVGLYLPVMGVVLLIYTLFFVGVVFGDWL
jgi:hypothetical protein